MLPSNGTKIFSQFSVLNFLHELSTKVCRLMKCDALYVLSLFFSYPVVLYFYVCFGGLCSLMSKNIQPERYLYGSNEFLKEW